MQNWILVRTGENLPDVDDEILFVEDLRGTQDEEINESLVKMKVRKPEPAQKVRHGYVTEVGYSEELEEHYIIACAGRTPNGSPISICYNITYWKPMDEPPIDTFKRSPYHHTEVFNIVMKEAREKEQRDEDDETE